MSVEGISRTLHDLVMDQQDDDNDERRKETAFKAYFIAMQLGWARSSGMKEIKNIYGEGVKLTFRRLLSTIMAKILLLFHAMYKIYLKYDLVSEHYGEDRIETDWQNLFISGGSTYFFWTLRDVGRHTGSVLVLTRTSPE